MGQESKGPGSLDRAGEQGGRLQGRLLFRRACPCQSPSRAGHTGSGSLGLPLPPPPLILTSTSIAERLQKGFPLPLPSHIQLLNLLLQSHQVSTKGPFSPNLPPQQQLDAESFLYASLVASAFYPCNNRERWGLSVNREGRLRLRTTTQLLKPRSKARFLLLTIGYIIPTRHLVKMELTW